jgi:hypothetical protein
MSFRLHTAAAIVSLLAGLLVIASFAGLLQIFPVETTTQTFTEGGWTGFGVEPGDELLSASRYVTAWSPSFVSQTIVAQGGVREEPFQISGVIDMVAYRVYVNTGGGWQAQEDLSREIPSPLAAGFEFTYPNHLFTIQGPVDGAVRVDFEVHFWLGSWVILARDEAYLTPGIGRVQWDKNQYAVGETASFTWEIPYVTDETEGTGWSAFVSYLDTGEVIWGPQTLTTLTGRVRIPITADLFRVSTDCKNVLRVVLRNELFSKDWDDTSTIDVAGAGPKITSLRTDHARYSLGEPVTIQWTASPNPETGLPVAQYSLTIGYGEPVDEVTLDAGVDRYVFRSTTIAGPLKISLVAVDTGCRPSAVEDLTVEVLDPAYDPPGGGTAFPLGLAVALLIGGVLAILFVRRLAQTPILALVLIALILIAVALLYVLIVEPILQGGFP